MTDKKNFEDMAVRVWNETANEETFSDWASNFLFYSHHKDELYETAVEKRREDVRPLLDEVVCSDIAGLITEFVGYE